ncbi:MAG: hypothetical protein L0228_22180 [Planctomycetes bacterium]|nr:hypothetical protein [Planctomycetota bacterium]
MPQAENNGQGEPQIAREAPPDPFDPARLRLSQDFAATIGVQKALLTVPVRKPDKSWFVRVHPDESYRLQTAVLNLKEDREVYLIEPALWSDLMTSEATFTFQALFTAITRQRTVFLWPIGLPGPDGKSNSWNDSAIQAATRAMECWVRVTANMQAGGYDIVEAVSEIPAPTWPDMSLRDLLEIAFRNRRIDSLDHPLLRRLRGEE